MPSVVWQQWQSRLASLSGRADLYPFAWRVLKENPLGVGPYNTPGTGHHAVDSLALTWMMEFGWPGLVLLAGLVLLLHGIHLMILYDKLSLVTVAALSALYALLRPWRRGGAVINMSSEICMI